jgi:PBSX family phage terminase large subunit
MSEEKRVIEFKPNPKQLLFLLATAMYVAFGGARGGGKSWAVQVKAVLLALRHPGIKILIVRRTLVELRNNHIDPLKQLLRGIARYNQQERKFIFPNGSTISFEFYDSDKDQFKYQGVQYDVIFIDEATQFLEEWLKIIASCCRGVNNFPKRIYYTCNPGGPGHSYIKRLFIDRDFREGENPDNYVFIQSLVLDNKALMETNPDYITYLKNLPPKLRQMWLYGDWQVAEGMYFEEFRNNPEGYKTHQWSHVIDPIKPRPHWKIYRSFDWGYAKPFSCGWWTEDEDGTLYRIDEMYGVQYSGGDPIPDVGVKWDPDRVFAEIRKHEMEHPYLKDKPIIGVADPAIWDAESGISFAETAGKHGVFFQPADNARIPGWMQMHYRLRFDENGYARMYICSNCRNFIRTITTLEYDEHIAEDLNTKGEDHAADEARYMCQLRKVRPIEPIEENVPRWGSDPLDQYTGRKRK